jgi:serine/threonine protein kinase
VLAAQEKLGHYVILSPLGSGGMGEVYRAKDTRLRRDVALKVLPRQFTFHPDRIFRFEQEARAASALNHPTIITIFDIGFIEEKAYIAMELVDGKNLAELLKAGRISLKKIIAISSQLADGLAKAHDAGIVHRDLKPENLMITTDGFLKILDFGLAKLADTELKDVSFQQTQTSAGVVVGTAGYMSPEQASGNSIDFRSDQFSFGSILYEMLTGQRAFKKGTQAETMAAVIREEPDSVSSIQPQVPGPLRWILERCMAKDPNERYASTRDLARDFQSLRDHFAEIASSGEATSSLARVKPRRSFLIVLLAAISLIAGAALPYFWSRSPSPPLIVSRTLTYSGLDSSPAISPNGQLIAFRSDRDGVPRIWLKQMQGGNEIAVTEGPDDYPRFSPDGSLLLFIRKQNTTGSLYRVPVLGGEPRKVIDDAVSADWSSDGKQIAFVRWIAGVGGFDSQLMTVKQDGSNPEKIL